MSAVLPHIGTKKAAPSACTVQPSPSCARKPFSSMCMACQQFSLSDSLASWSTFLSRPQVNCIPSS